MGSFNYFNYFTEIEEHFWRKRGAHLLVSPLDWAIVETWQKAGIPLDAVLRGIDQAFESYQRSRRAAGRPLKSLAYCVDAVLDAATQLKETAVGAGPEAKRPANSSEPFSRDELRAFLSRNTERLARGADKLSRFGPRARSPHRSDCALRLAELAPLLDSPAQLDLEDLERRLTVLEEKLTAALTAAADEETLLDHSARPGSATRSLSPRMTAEQLSQLERQYTQKRLFERFDLPRLSLFYLT